MNKKAKVLNSRGRKRIAKKNFALPGGRYPIHDASHARNALARVSQHGTPEEQTIVRARVNQKYPNMGKEKEAQMETYYTNVDLGFLKEATPIEAEAAKSALRAGLDSGKALLSKAWGATKGAGQTVKEEVAAGAGHVSREAKAGYNIAKKKGSEGYKAGKSIVKGEGTAAAKATEVEAVAALKAAEGAKVGWLGKLLGGEGKKATEVASKREAMKLAIKKRRMEQLKRGGAITGLAAVPVAVGAKMASIDPNMDRLQQWIAVNR